ncbi:CarD family transcriptional regulator [Aestuariivirga litoralis]|uniref:CarD family transcriptional regulator n=1 Tax=Aestuariivirga litoralis TaxID=2650924 RepID=UPI0018C759FC|nr:CarD family transcriptional regulator [Aestuariivirga litoralis]MBG1233374.1 CarD family transcriptional regulator [Aestuariivirga litoralis]
MPTSKKKPVKAAKKTVVKAKAKPAVVAKAKKPEPKKIDKAAVKQMAKTAAAKHAATQKAAAAAKPVAAKPAPAAKPAAAAPAAKAAATPAPKKINFKVGELVVYPAHGVGKISNVEEQEIAGVKLELYIVDFEKEKLRLKVPTNRAEQKGMRHLADRAMVEAAMKVIRGRARIKRTMWSRRAQEYDAKINSGDLISVAEVVRDLYRSERQPEQSYSERQLFEQALERFARELAAVRKVDEDQCIRELEEYLARNAKRSATESTKSDEDSAEEAA